MTMMDDNDVKIVSDMLDDVQPKEKSKMKMKKRELCFYFYRLFLCSNLQDFFFLSCLVRGTNLTFDSTG